MIEALRLTFDANCLPRTSVLQGHKFIRKNNGAVKSTSDFADGNKIKWRGCAKLIPLATV